MANSTRPTSQKPVQATTGTKKVSNKSILARTKAQSSQPSFMGLPPELRIRIHNYALHEKRGFMVSKAEGIPEPGLLRASKTVRREALGIYYTVNTVGIVINSYDFSIEKLLIAKFRALARTYGYFRPPRLMRRYRGLPSWKNLKNGLRLQHEDKLFRTGTLDTDGQLSNIKPEIRVIYGMITAVRAMRGSKWEDVEQTLELLRPGLIAIHPGWVSNRW